MTSHPSLTLALGLGLLLPLAMVAPSARAQDQAEVAPSKIIGNRELPCGAGTALTRQGLTARQDGNFVAAGQAWAQALKTDSSCAAAALNLGVLNDLYLGSSDEALRWYQQYQTLAAAQGLGADAQVGKWITEVQRRLPMPAAPEAAPNAASAPAKETTP